MVELAADSLRLTGSLRLRVMGSSMLPAVRPGDVLAIDACSPEQAFPGEVVLFRREGRLFAHRVVERSASALRTRGDALASCDVPVDASELLGKVVAIERRGRPLGPVKPAGRLERLAAQLFRRSALAARLFSRWNARP